MQHSLYTKYNKHRMIQIIQIEIKLRLSMVDLRRRTNKEEDVEKESTNVDKR